MFTYIKRIYFLILMTISYNVYSQPLLLSDKPLFLSQSVPPALAITFDDSGSMALASMPESRYFDPNRISFASNDYNSIYYDPNIQYLPPIQEDGTALPNADFANARLDGYYLNSNFIDTIDLNSEYIPIELYRPYYDSLDGTRLANIPGASYSIEYAQAGQTGATRAFYYTWNGPSNASGSDMLKSLNFTLHEITTDTEKQNFANWYSYYNTRSKLAKAATSTAFASLGSGFKIDWQQINNFTFASKVANMETFEANHRKDFYDWLYLIPSLGPTPLRRATMQAGELFTRSSVYYDSVFGGELSCQQNFHVSISDGAWNNQAGLLSNHDGQGLTLPQLPDNSTMKFDPSTFPGEMYVNNESATLADTAFYYWATDLRPIDNNVPTLIEDYTDHKGGTIDLKPDELWWQNSELFWNPNNDPANWQHMVNFNVGLGITGILDPTNDLAGIRDGSIKWPETAGGFRLTAAARVDDVWHASLNSRGKYFSAKNPVELSKSLYDVITNIIKRNGKSSAGSISSNIISSDALTYNTGFDLSDWSGFVVAKSLNSDGTPGTVHWDASCKLTGGYCNSTNSVVGATTDNSSRNIITYDPNLKLQHPFNKTNMSGLERAQILNSTFYTQSVTNNNAFTADEVIEFVRGDRSKEIQFGGQFRNRQSLLGDIMHSPAKIIRGPSASYNDNIWEKGSPEFIAMNNGNGYSDFRELNKNRNSVILVGANDGMLHAFDAGINSNNGGDELWAYMPSTSLIGLSEFASPQYNHKSYVDAAPFVKDAFIDNTWKTIALGGIRKGGKLFYALDLDSNLTSIPKILWEFSDVDEPNDMGFSYSGGVITRVVDKYDTTNSKWIALLPNGYNSASQQSVMFALDLESGLVLHKWNYGVGDISHPNGMGPPVVADFVVYDSNDSNTTYYGSDQASDYSYAGDLAGNVYRFNLQDIFSGTINSKPEILFSGNYDQPITTAPRVFATKDGTENVIVVFGTGKYLEFSDNNSNISTKQYLFGVRDSMQIANNYNLNDPRLVEQTISSSDGKNRILSTKSVNLNQGWKIELPDLGERMVTTIGRNSNLNLMTVATIIPNGKDPCLSGGESWVMVLNASTGSTPSTGHLFNGSSSDGVYINDLVLGFNYLTVPGGDQMFISIDTSGNGSNSGDLLVELSKTSKWKRRSWHRLLLD